jgi:hypothetical protein
MTEYEIPFIYKFEIVTESDFGFSMGRAPTCICRQNPVCVRWKKKAEHGNHEVKFSNEL